MTEQLDVAGDRVTVVHLAGELTLHSTADTRAGLLRAVAGRPDLIVADVSRMAVDDEVGLALFPAVARHAAAWPGIPLVLAAPDAQLAEAFERNAVAHYLPVFDTVGRACQAGDRPRPPRMCGRVGSGPAAVGAARHLVARACRQWGLDRLSDLAQLVVTELASNAVRHAGGEVRVVVLHRRRYLHVSVRDRSPETPRPGRSDGRGLLLVDALTAGWGCTALDDGKVVWATLRLA